MSEHVLRLSGGEVLVVSSHARRQAAYLLRVGLEVTSRRDGIAAPALATLIVEAFAAPTSGEEVAEVPQSLDLSASISPNLIGTKEIAAMLNTTDRNARDLCRRHSLESAVQVGRCWLADHDEVARRATTRAH